MKINNIIKSFGKMIEVKEEQIIIKKELIINKHYIDNNNN
jgi:hypothetical protein